MSTANFELETVSIRFIRGDLDALRKLDPTITPSAHVRQLIHRYVRRELAARGWPAPSVPQAPPSSEEAGL
jgi:hypothetical protein